MKFILTNVMCKIFFFRVDSFLNHELTLYTVQHTRNRNISLIPRLPYFISIFPSEDGYRSISLALDQHIGNDTFTQHTYLYIHSRIHTIAYVSEWRVPIFAFSFALFSSYRSLTNAALILRYGNRILNTNSDSRTNEHSL